MAAICTNCACMAVIIACIRKMQNTGIIKLNQRLGLGYASTEIGTDSHCRRRRCRSEAWHVSRADVHLHNQTIIRYKIVIPQTIKNIFCV